MNHHEFVHEMTLIHASIRKIERELKSVKQSIEGFVITPQDILSEKEAQDGKVA